MDDGEFTFDVPEMVEDVDDDGRTYTYANIMPTNIMSSTNIHDSNSYSYAFRAPGLVGVGTSDHHHPTKKLSSLSSSGAAPPLAHLEQLDLALCSSFLVDQEDFDAYVCYGSPPALDYSISPTGIGSNNDSSNHISASAASTISNHFINGPHGSYSNDSHHSLVIGGKFGLHLDEEFEEGHRNLSSMVPPLMAPGLTFSDPQPHPNQHILASPPTIPPLPTPTPLPTATATTVSSFALASSPSSSTISTTSAAAAAAAAAATTTTTSTTTTTTTTTTTATTATTLTSTKTATTTTATMQFPARLPPSSSRASPTTTDTEVAQDKSTPTQTTSIPSSTFSVAALEGMKGSEDPTAKETSPPQPLTAACLSYSHSLLQANSKDPYLYLPSASPMLFPIDGHDGHRIHNTAIGDTHLRTAEKDHHQQQQSHMCTSSHGEGYSQAHTQTHAHVKLHPYTRHGHSDTSANANGVHLDINLSSNLALAASFGDAAGHGNGQTNRSSPLPSPALCPSLSSFASPAPSLIPSQALPPPPPQLSDAIMFHATSPRALASQHHQQQQHQQQRQQRQQHQLQYHYDGHHPLLLSPSPTGTPDDCSASLESTLRQQKASLQTPNLQDEATTLDYRGVSLSLAVHLSAPIASDTTAIDCSAVENPGTFSSASVPIATMTGIKVELDNNTTSDTALIPAATTTADGTPTPAPTPATTKTTNQGKKNIKRHKCPDPTCPATFARRMGVENHLLSAMHNKSSETRKRHFCPVEGCGKSFNYVHDLKRHQLGRHEEASRFECSVDGCNQKFSRTDVAKAHYLKKHASKVVADGTSSKPATLLATSTYRKITAPTAKSTAAVKASKKSIGKA